MSVYIQSLCWIDKDTLILGDYSRHQLIQYTIDTTKGTCSGTVIGEGYKIWSVSCSSDSKIYVSEYTAGEVKIRIYDLQSGMKEVWNPNVYSTRSNVHVAVNDEFIVITAGNVNYVYNKDGVLLYNRTHDQVSMYFFQTYITHTGVFWGTGWGGYKLLTMNLHTKDVHLITGGVLTPRGLSGTGKGHVFVSENGFEKFGVYSANGTFLHFLQVWPEDGEDLVNNGAIRTPDQETFIAFRTMNINLPVVIYSVKP